ncbi:hypothetical protein Tco_0953437 [Tanacetum coccineum]|uniref:Uncharacterized protein n=1 Tax=Tanacetum coccineum TaxID=301880 RepID=A0ABQ5E0K9_9ASTR
MTSRSRTHYSAATLIKGVTDWYQSQGYREPGQIFCHVFLIPVTYTSLYTDSEPGRVFWGADEELSDGGSPRVVAPLPPDFVPEPVYPEFLVPSDAEAPMEEQPYATDASPIALSPGYAMHYEDDADDEDKETSDEEEEEHLAPADPSAVPVVDHVPSAGDTEAVEAEEPAPTPGSPRTKYAAPHLHQLPHHLYYHLGHSILLLSIPFTPQPHLPSHSTTPVPASLLLPSPPLPPPVPALLPLPSSPLPPLPSLLFIPPLVDRREDIPEAELPPCKRLCTTMSHFRYEVEEVFDCLFSLFLLFLLFSLGPRPTRGHRVDYGFIGTLDAKTRRQRVEQVGYGIRDVWLDSREAAEEIAPTTLEGVNTWVTEHIAVQEQDTQDIYDVIEDTQDRQESFYFRELMNWSDGIGRIQDSHLDPGSSYRCPGVTDSGVDRRGFITAGTANNMPPKRTSATVRTAVVRIAAVVVAAAAIIPMIAAVVE